MGVTFDDTEMKFVFDFKHDGAIMNGTLRLFINYSLFIIQISSFIV